MLFENKSSNKTLNFVTLIFYILVILYAQKWLLLPDVLFHYSDAFIGKLSKTAVLQESSPLRTHSHAPT